jgi:hypothetical protein
MPVEAVSSTVPRAPATPVTDAADLRGRARQRLLWSYGLGDAGTGMSASLIGFYLFVFYTSAAGLPPWMAGLVLMAGRLWDGINDPVVGWLSDKTHSRWGPRLPWILGAAIPLGITMAAMWWVPPGSTWVKFAIFVAISTLAQTFYTAVNLPYSALAAELTGPLHRLDHRQPGGGGAGGPAAAGPQRPRQLPAGGRAGGPGGGGGHPGLRLGTRSSGPALPAADP